ncbi:phage major capsid protein [Mycobacterium sp. 94-17]|uniref:phage major capsid protein n=1 Tax=Mycobacterium sp. 94-17 TaxID=2986147 RepID=UPI002D1ECB75|nr:phage major capsid protein [Mycobacterium sp. 94-17]MEB4208764.1 phage major capsid protein [Mycobacterium sp. 94-17]
MTIENLTREQALQRADELHDQMDALNSKHRAAKTDAAEFDRLGDEFDLVARHIQHLDRAAVIARASSGSLADPPPGQLRIERGSAGDYDVDPLRDPRSAGDRRFRNPWDLSEVRTFREPGVVAGELRARALSAIEAMPGASDRIRSAATNIIEKFDSQDSRLARHVLVTSSPAYMRAWSKMATSKQDSLTPEERRAIADVDQYRAMSLTDSGGGFLVPFQLDPTVIITSAGSRNDIRQAARQVVATGDVWNGVSSAAVQWSWDAEASEVSDDSPPFAQPSIPVYKAAGFVPISIEASADEQNVAQQVGRLLAQGREDLEAVALITGSGTGMPTGIVTALSGSSSVVNSKSTDTFALADVYALHGSLPARYRNNAKWLSNNLIYNLIRQFDTYGGAGLWTTLGNGTPPNLMGYPNLEAEAIDGSITASAENYSLIFGDFENYVIADRLGMTVEFIPHLFHTANNRPSGQRGWYAYYRVGADSVNDAAFRMLDVT